MCVCFIQYIMDNAVIKYICDHNCERVKQSQGKKKKKPQTTQERVHAGHKRAPGWTLEGSSKRKEPFGYLLDRRNPKTKDLSKEAAIWPVIMGGPD